MKPTTKSRVRSPRFSLATRSVSHTRQRQPTPRRAPTRFRRLPLRHSVVRRTCKTSLSVSRPLRRNLKELNVSTFDDYVKYLPNVSAASNGPGQNEIFMRGLSAGVQPSQGSGSTGLFPNVAIYLDDQSGQLPNRNLDIYAADLERIEILEGPQGTLFGAGPRPARFAISPISRDSM